MKAQQNETPKGDNKTEQEPANLSFETLLDKTNQIIEKLQSGDLPLEQALKLYEQGHHMLAEAEKRLMEAKFKLEILSKSEAKDNDHK